MKNVTPVVSPLPKTTCNTEVARVSEDAMANKQGGFGLALAQASKNACFKRMANAQSEKVCSLGDEFSLGVWGVLLCETASA